MASGLFVTRWRSPQGGPGWLVASNPSHRWIASSREEVLPVLRQAEQASASGQFVAGFIAYEAAPVFDESLAVHANASFPLAAFSIYENPPTWFRALHPLPGRSASIRERPAVEQGWYAERFQQVHDGIGAGDFYQVNLTFPLDIEFEGDPWALFVRLNGACPAPYATFFDLPEATVVSISPELFFEKQGPRVRCAPMKGTATRSEDLATDLRNAHALQASEKDRAENLMIVDMVRNDLGRIAKWGSVNVDSLFAIERYPTVWQMTSAVTAETDRGLCDVMGALFPGASVTGAPKGSAMQAIRSLESGPRGVYTGALGFMSSESTRFSMPIRTVTLAQGRAHCHVGSGLVWDSDCDAEWLECLAKSLYLSAGAEAFALLETLRREADGSYALLDDHLERLGTACSRFGVPFDAQQVECLLEQATGETGVVHKVRLKIGLDGVPQVESSPLGDVPAEISARIADRPVASNDPLLAYKTTLRDAYADSPWDADEVLQFNERDEATEFINGNLVADFGGVLKTPPLRCGVLDGTLRRKLVCSAGVVEAILPVSELAGASEMFRVNSVRGWQRVRLS